MRTSDHGTQDRIVEGKIRDGLERRIGTDRFGIWFGDRVRFEIGPDGLTVWVEGEFALERLRGHYYRQIESIAAEVVGGIVPVKMSLWEERAGVLSSEEREAATSLRPSVPTPTAVTTDVQTIRSQPVRSIRVSSPNPIREMPPQATVRRGIGGGQLRVGSGPVSVRPSFPSSGVESSGDASVREGAGRDPGGVEDGALGESLAAPGRRVVSMTFTNFMPATSNELAVTAAKLLAADPIGSAPLCFWGPTGTGKTHLLHAIRNELRARHGMPRVILLSAEQFTNDFLACVRGTGLPAFRKRYRDADALLIDNVQFLGGKTATLRETLYTVDALLTRRRPLVLAADRQPLEIDGLAGDLAGRMSSGLVCGINPMERELRKELFRRHAEQSYLPWDEATIEVLAERTIGDGRVIQGVAQLVSMLQRMYRRMPTLQEIAAQAGDMLQRGPKVVALADIEKAICSTFGITTQELRSEAKSRSVSHPRILAMYLSREHTTAAFSEIGRYYGDRNHSTVIAAHRRVGEWLQGERTLGGRGPKGMKVREAIAAVESLLRIG